MRLQITLRAFAVIIFSLLPVISVAGDNFGGKTVRFDECSKEQRSFLERASIVDGSDFSVFDLGWIEMHSVRFVARREILTGSDIECGAYPFTFAADTFFFRFKGVCREGYCYTFIFDGFGVKHDITKEPFHYFGLTQGDFERASEKTSIESLYSPGLAFPFGVSYWVDFAASGRIKFMLPPIKMRS